MAAIDSANFKEQVGRLHENKFTVDDLFVVKTDGKLPPYYFCALRSLAIWPLYGGIFVLMAVVLLVSLLIKIIA